MRSCRYPRINDSKLTVLYLGTPQVAATARRLTLRCSGRQRCSHTRNYPGSVPHGRYAVCHAVCGARVLPAVLHASAVAAAAELKVR
jgi:hypothetical protein